MMTQNNKAKFYVDEDKCTGCSRCVNYQKLKESCALATSSLN